MLECLDVVGAGPETRPAWGLGSRTTTTRMDLAPAEGAPAAQGRLGGLDEQQQSLARPTSSVSLHSAAPGGESAQPGGAEAQQGLQGPALAQLQQQGWLGQGAPGAQGGGQAAAPALTNEPGQALANGPPMPPQALLGLHTHGPDDARLDQPALQAPGGLPGMLQQQALAAQGQPSERPGSQLGLLTTGAPGQFAHTSSWLQSLGGQAAGGLSLAQLSGTGSQVLGALPSGGSAPPGPGSLAPQAPGAALQPSSGGLDVAQAGPPPNWAASSLAALGQARLSQGLGAPPGPPPQTAAPGSWQGLSPQQEASLRFQLLAQQQQQQQGVQPPQAAGQSAQQQQLQAMAEAQARASLGMGGQQQAGGVSDMHLRALLALQGGGGDVRFSSGQALPDSSARGALGMQLGAMGVGRSAGGQGLTEAQLRALADAQAAGGQQGGLAQGLMDAQLRAQLGMGLGLGARASVQAGAEAALRGWGAKGGYPGSLQAATDAHAAQQQQQLQQQQLQQQQLQQQQKQQLLLQSHMQQQMQHRRMAAQLAAQHQAQQHQAQQQQAQQQAEQAAASNASAHRAALDHLMQQQAVHAAQQQAQADARASQQQQQQQQQAADSALAAATRHAYAGASQEQLLALMQAGHLGGSGSLTPEALRVLDALRAGAPAAWPAPSQASQPHPASPSAASAHSLGIGFGGASAEVAEGGFEEGTMAAPEGAAPAASALPADASDGGAAKDLSPEAASKAGDAVAALIAPGTATGEPSDTPLAAKEAAAPDAPSAEPATSDAGTAAAPPPLVRDISVGCLDALRASQDRAAAAPLPSAPPSESGDVDKAAPVAGQASTQQLAHEQKSMLERMAFHCGGGRLADPVVFPLGMRSPASPEAALLGGPPGAGGPLPPGLGAHMSTLTAQMAHMGGLGAALPPEPGKQTLQQQLAAAASAAQQVPPPAPPPGPSAPSANVASDAFDAARLGLNGLPPRSAHPRFTVEAAQNRMFCHIR